ncbi:unnamed protein product [Sympodiomycopsis kandeliae]
MVNRTPSSIRSSVKAVERSLTSSSGRNNVASSARRCVATSTHYARLQPLRRCAPTTSTIPSPRNQIHTTTPHYSQELSISQYHAISDTTFDQLVNELDELIEGSELAGDHDWEFDFSQGVLNLKLKPIGTYVLNKQPPNKQIWLSSPISGPKRFDFDLESNTWVCNKDGQLVHLDQLLNGELSGIFKTNVQLLQSN